MDGYNEADRAIAPARPASGATVPAVARPGLWARLIACWKSRFGPVVCPLCNSRSLYEVQGSIGYEDLLNALGARPEWGRAHGLATAVVPQMKDAGGLMLPALDPATPGAPRSPHDVEHRRCSGCHSLLPSQFWAEGGNFRFPIAVAGMAEAGKTTWLLNTLSHPTGGMFHVVRPSPQVFSADYEFVEPVTRKFLSVTNARTAINYMLWGAQVRFGATQILVPTLDVRGEAFSEQEAVVASVITNHLRVLAKPKQTGALLVVEKYQLPSQSGGSNHSIAAVYSRIMVMPEHERVWCGILWTNLDRASWGAEGDTWATAEGLPVSFLGLVRAPASRWWDDQGMVNAVTTGDMLVLVDRVLKGTKVNPDYLPGALDGKLRRGLKDSFLTKTKDAVSAPPVEPLIALLFRLQILYSQRAASHPHGKYRYFRSSEGGLWIEALQELAAALYFTWDRTRPNGGMGGYVLGTRANERPFRVLPCGLVTAEGLPWNGDTDGARGAGAQGVWADLALLSVIDDERMG